MKCKWCVYRDKRNPEICKTGVPERSFAPLQKKLPLPLSRRRGIKEMEL
jgi:hypothetical protein